MDFHECINNTDLGPNSPTAVEGGTGAGGAASSLPAMPPPSSQSCNQCTYAYEGRYSTTVYTEHVQGFINNWKPADKPIFTYLAYQAVHEPMDAPASYIEPYVDIDDPLSILITTTTDHYQYRSLPILITTNADHYLQVRFNRRSVEKDLRSNAFRLGRRSWQHHNHTERERSLRKQCNGRVQRQRRHVRNLRPWLLQLRHLVRWVELPVPWLQGLILGRWF